MFVELHRLDHSDSLLKLDQINLCYGKEWHRFPSSFFLPNDKYVYIDIIKTYTLESLLFRWNMKFIKSEFKGQLPNYYSTLSNGSKISPDHMNDMNIEEPTRYVSNRFKEYLM